MSSRMMSFRLYPSPKQETVLNRTLDVSRSLYNHLLETKIKAYETEKISLRKFDLNKRTTELKKINPDLKTVHSQVLQNVSDRLTKAFENFYRRVKAGEKPGFPRFKSFDRYNSITYPQSGFALLGDRKIRLSKIGEVKIILHQKLVGKAKTLTIKRTPTGKWFAVFSCEIEDRPAKHAHPEREIGLDVGLESFATLSDGTKIGNPRFLVASEKRLAILQRRFSKKTRRSANRESARLKVARLHEKIANQRHDFLHKLSRFLVNRYGKIAIEDLNISNMVRHPYLAKSINDASWGTFARFLAYKAEEAGCEVVKVNPRGTSQNCSQCGIKVPKTLAQRWHLCPNCGLHLDRDINASRNILKTSIRGIRKSQARGEGSSILGEILEFSPSAKREAPQLVGG